MARRRLAWLVLLLVVAGPVQGAPGLRDYVVRWLPPDGPAPEGYRLEVSSEDRSASSSLDIGWVPTDADGVARYTVELPADAGSYLQMKAYNTAGESQPSNEIFVAAPLCDPSFCDDGNPCTADDCGATGCTRTQLPDGTLCREDGAVCMQGTCGVSECVVDADCPSTGLCDQAPRCENFMCVAGAPLECGEPTACAVPTCDTQHGCQMVTLSDGTPCDDGDPGTRRDQCLAGVCQGVSKEFRGAGKAFGRR